MPDHWGLWAKVLTIAVTALILIGFSAWVHSYANQVTTSGSSLNNAVSKNITSYSLGGYELTFTGGNTVELNNGSAPMTINFSVFSAVKNKFTQGTPETNKFNRINNNGQNALLVSNTYSSGAVTYIFGTSGGFELDWNVPPITGLYILFNISMGKTYSISSGNFIYSYNNSNSPEFGSYLVSSSFESWGINFSTASGSANLSWFQVQTQNKIVYEKVIVTPKGDYMNLMTGPYNSGSQATYSYTGIEIS